MDITGHEVGAVGRRVYKLPARLAVRGPIPSLWTTEGKPGWQPICRRRRREASRHHLATDSDYFYSYMQALVQRCDKCLNANGDYVEV